MNVLAINGSPRKKWNTATLLEHALEGRHRPGQKQSASTCTILTTRDAPVVLPAN